MKTKQIKKKQIYIATICLTFLLLITPCLADSKNNNKKPFWWKVELQIKVTGQYSYQTRDNGFDGRFSFDAHILGSMQTDEDDYIFMQAFQQIKNKKWQETVFSKNNRQTFTLNDKIKPDITLNYVFKKKGTLSFDHDFRPVSIPSPNPVLKLYTPLQLLLPQSAGDNSISEKSNYNNGILSGSNRVILKDRDIHTKELNIHSFNWTWQEKSNNWSTKHSAEVTLRVIRLPMEEQ